LVSRTAEQPGQTLNVDLCFVPADHPSELRLPAVSGSSGRLIVSPSPAETTKPSAPGLVFADDSLDYTEAMLRFVAASRAADGLAPASSQPATADEPPSRKAHRQALRQAADELRRARRQQRAQRKIEDAAWAVLRAQARTAAPTDPTAPGLSRYAAAKRKQRLRAPRRAQRQQRAREDEDWRQRRQQLRAQRSALPLISAWIAILVVTDNCTRQCLGLPLFVTGSHVTAELVVTALQALLPPELQFLISDRGPHFIAKAFAALKQRADFIHVLIARHRPQSNGIAERFVRTLKEWLATQTWQSASELEILLAQFMAEYNDRPHRGLAIPGLSPNEFARRCWIS
jgi:transposase InsO family protein